MSVEALSHEVNYSNGEYNSHGQFDSSGDLLIGAPSRELLYDKPSYGVVFEKRDIYDDLSNLSENLNNDQELIDKNEKEKVFDTQTYELSEDGKIYATGEYAGKEMDNLSDEQYAAINLAFNGEVSSIIVDSPIDETVQIEIIYSPAGLSPEGRPLLQVASIEKIKEQIPEEDKEAEDIKDFGGNSHESSSHIFDEAPEVAEVITEQVGELQEVAELIKSEAIPVPNDDVAESITENYPQIQNEIHEVKPVELIKNYEGEFEETATTPQDIENIIASSEKDIDKIVPTQELEPLIDLLEYEEDAYKFEQAPEKKPTAQNETIKPAPKPPESTISNIKIEKVSLKISKKLAESKTTSQEKTQNDTKKRSEINSLRTQIDQIFNDKPTALTDELHEEAHDITIKNKLVSSKNEEMSAKTNIQLESISQLNIKEDIHEGKTSTRADTEIKTIATNESQSAEQVKENTDPLEHVYEIANTKEPLTKDNRITKPDSIVTEQEDSISGLNKKADSASKSYHEAYQLARPSVNIFSLFDNDTTAKITKDGDLVIVSKTSRKKSKLKQASKEHKKAHV